MGINYVIALVHCNSVLDQCARPSDVTVLCALKRSRHLAVSGAGDPGPRRTAFRRNCPRPEQVLAVRGGQAALARELAWRLGHESFRCVRANA